VLYQVSINVVHERQVLAIKRVHKNKALVTSCPNFYARVSCQEKTLTVLLLLILRSMDASGKLLWGKFRTTRCVVRVFKVIQRVYSVFMGVRFIRYHFHIAYNNVCVGNISIHVSILHDNNVLIRFVHTHALFLNKLNTQFQDVRGCFFTEIAK